MTMSQPAYYDTSFGRINGWRFGQGSQLMLALHGFSETGRTMRVLAKSLAAQYTLIAIDLPFHGKTCWDAAYFTRSAFHRAISQIMAAENHTRCTLLGVSFGARLALGMLPLLKSQLDALVLLSPDGLKTRPLSVAENTPLWMRRMLRKQVENPAWLLSIAALARKIGLISGPTAQFLSQNLSSPERINRIFACWLAMESFKIQPAEIRAILAASGVRTRVMVGADDPLLDVNRLKAVFEGLPNVQLSVLAGEGHQLLGAKLPISF